MKRAFLTLITCIGLAVGSLAVANPALADVCKAWNSSWNLKEGSVPITVAKITTHHTVCVTTGGFTFRNATRDASTTTLGKSAGFVFEFDSIRPVQTTTSFDGWKTHVRYNVCLWKYKVRVCNPSWGEFNVWHRAARPLYTNNVFVNGDGVVDQNAWAQNIRWSRP